VSAFQFTDFKEQLEYLHDRGIDDITIKRLGLEVKTATWLKEQGFPQVPGLARGIVWAMRDINGQVTGKLGARVFYSKGIIVDQDKPKFLPPKGQVPGVYFSPLVDWDKLEYGQRIFICESYLKADIAALLGFHAIGVSGCWGWSYNKELNWDFNTIPWEQGLIPVVCFDSNVNQENVKLWQAARRLSAALEVKHRVRTEIAILPPPKEGDWGLDDYYREHGKDATRQLLLSDAEPLVTAMTDHLTVMSTEVCYAREIARFIEVDTGLIMTRGDFENATYANRIVWNEDGKPVSVAKSYTRWEKRTEVNSVVYRPGSERLMVPEYYNLWRGMGVEPLAADATLFTEWVETVFTTSEAHYFLDWWSYQLQHLGGKLTTSLVVVGPPGIGKGWITAIMERIFGTENVSKIPITVLERHFNADVAAKQLLIVEETDEVGGNSQAIYNKLKDMITSTTIRLEKKGVDPVLIPNTLNCFLTGNQIGIFKLDSHDRRFAVLEAREPDSSLAVANSQSYWDKRWEWLEEAGPSAVYAHLLGRDLARFNPHGMAPMTSAKKDMIEVRQGTMEGWLDELWHHPDEVLQSGHSEVDGCLASAKELMWLFLGGRVPMHEIDREQVTKMNRALKNARFELANDGKKIKDLDGYPTRYFIIRPLVNPISGWGDLVKDRLFWQRLVASQRESSSQPDPDGNQSPSKKY